MFPKKHTVNLVVTPLELKLCRSGVEPGLLTVFNPFDFFVMCNGKYVTKCGIIFFLTKVISQCRLPSQKTTR
jgi:hypothetical protein